ncbi:hypothetical protein HUT18_22585 [Streptomyces sp. NA04227]|uniref:hypothetical protein n=1 Tax=Streptomyces sp. NA04227 TaxID=2742136 RepID=UPI0015916E66|nr:hypothetical protein [Streptomyces sp. NA04227]QKW08747.1 hypothetical protein HUT18_22585 [Streptomyces sp. NA04227]
MSGRTGEATRYDRRMYALMNRREAASWYATAARRRLFVLGHIALSAASVACWLYAVVGDRDWALLVLLAALLPWCVATGVINTATKGLLELRRHVLDERQRAEKDQVVSRAHRLTTWLLAAATAGAGALAWSGTAELRTLAFPVLFTVLVAHWLMPLWVAGLSARDEPAEDPAEEFAVGY